MDDNNDRPGSSSQQGLRKNCNETTPLSKQNLGRSQHGHGHGVSESQSLSKMHQGFTPKNRLNTSDSKNYSTNEFSITNPFEAHVTVDSFLQPSFSPSVFGNNSKSDSEKKSESFWSIEQIAVLKPVDIDLSHLHKQEEYVVFDDETEKKAQQAIENFFNSHTNMASPWSGEKPKPYLALISPSPGPMKKRPLLKSSATGSSSSTSSLSMSSQVNLQRFKNTRLQAHKEEIETESEKETVSSTTTVATQTVLTLPTKFDLEKVLSEYFTYHQDNRMSSEGQVEILSNSSLRRKLFFPACDLVDNNDVMFKNQEHENDPIPLSGDDVMKSSGQCFNFEEPIANMIQSNLITPVKQKTSHSASIELSTPRSQIKQRMAATPSTCNTQFSTSPVSGGSDFLCDVDTPCSRIYQESPLLLSGQMKKRHTGSSSEEHALESPGLSPMLKTTDLLFKENLESTDFDVGKCTGSVVNSPMHIAQESSNLDSPPISPIEPIKFTNKIHKSSSVLQFKSSCQNAESVSMLPALNLSPIDSSNHKKSKEKKQSEAIPTTPLSVKHIKSIMQSTKNNVYSNSGPQQLHPSEKTLENISRKNNLSSKIDSFDERSPQKCKNKTKSLSFFPPPSICSSAIFATEDSSCADSPEPKDAANDDFTRSVVLDTASRHHTMWESMPMQFESRLNSDKYAISNSNANTSLEDSKSADNYANIDYKLHEQSNTSLGNIVVPSDNMSVDMSFGNNKENIDISKYDDGGLKFMNEMEVSMRASPMLDGNLQVNSSGKSTNVNSVDSGYSATSQHTRNYMETG